MGKEESGAFSAGESTAAPSQRNGFCRNAARFSETPRPTRASLVKGLSQPSD
jgi:hypothetical protein